MTDAPPILRSMDRDRLWGRDEIAAKLFEAYGNGHRIFGLESVSGDGQSEFLFQFSRTLQEERGPDPIILAGGMDRTEAELIASLYKSLTEVPCTIDERLDEAAKRFVSKLPRKLKRLAGAMMKDIANAATLGAAKDTIDQIADLASGVDSDPDPFDDLLSEASDNKRKLIAKALEFVSDLGKPLCIVVEDFQLLDATAADFLRTLLRSKPPSCVLIIAANVEEPCTADWEKIKQSIELRPGLVVQLPEIDRDELCLWFQSVMDREPSDEEVDRLLESSNGGRPVYVSWVLEAWQNEGALPHVPDLLEVVLRRKRNGMCDDARLVGDLLSLLPGSVAVPVDLLGSALALNGLDLQKALDDASARGLLKQVGQRVKFGHSSYARPWLSEIDQTKHAELRILWYKAFMEIGFAPNIARIPGLIPLFAGDIVREQSSEEVESLANQLEALGLKEDSLILHELSYRNADDQDRGGSKS